ncbi:unnamed protein product, partial [Symbiodinium pilosum]
MVYKPGNYARDFFKNVKVPLVSGTQDLNDPTNVTVPVYRMINGQLTEVETTVPVLDVHELLDYLRTELKLAPPTEVVHKYWQHLRDCDMPHAKHFPGTDDHIPFTLYGDECVLGDPKDKVTGIFLSLTLFKPKTIREGQFLLFCMQDEHMVHDELKTLRPVLQHLVWGCNVAFNGVYPENDAFGRPLPLKKRRWAGTMMADGCRYACAELRGDWKYHERILRLRATPVSRECCFFCDAEASDGNLRYYSIGDEAPWVATETNTAGLINRAFEEFKAWRRQQKVQ